MQRVLLMLFCIPGFGLAVSLTVLLGWMTWSLLTSSVDTTWRCL